MPRTSCRSVCKPCHLLVPKLILSDRCQAKSCKIALCTNWCDCSAKTSTILSIGISKGRIAYQKLIGSRHVKTTVPTATSHWANSQTCCMQDERLCLPLIPSFDVPFVHKKGLKHVLVRLLWHGFTEAHDHVSPFCLEYRHVA